MRAFNNILLVEDNPGDIRLVQEYLRERFGDACELRQAKTLAAGVAALQAAPADLVLLDLGLPDSAGLATFFAVNAVAPDTPVVILTGDDDEDAAIAALQVGAEDYLAKRHADSAALIHAMRHAVQRRKMTDRLRNSEARYRAIVETAEEGILQADTDATVRFANARMLGMLGMAGGSAAPLAGRNLVNWVVPQDVPALQRLMSTQPGERCSCELQLLRADGAAAWVMAAAGSAILQRDPQLGPQRQVVLMLTDISGRKLAEAELDAVKQALERRVAERTAQLQTLNADLEAFNYTVAHDLRTPLNGILGFAALMRLDETHALPAPQERRLQIIEQSAQLMDGLIGSLLQLARLEREDMVVQPLDVSAIATTIAGSLSASDGQRCIEWQIDAGLRCNGDPALVTAAITNLLHNAWKYSAKTAHAKIHVGQLPTQPSQPAEFFVQDNGIGFDMASAGGLFAPFHRMPSAQGFAGNGIGLATVRRIIERHGGKIRAQSQPGRGATFFFTLPHDAVPVHPVG